MLKLQFSRWALPQYFRPKVVTGQSDVDSLSRIKLELMTNFSEGVSLSKQD